MNIMHFPESIFFPTVHASVRVVALFVTWSPASPLQKIVIKTSVTIREILY